jgi:hypothetical protein
MRTSDRGVGEALLAEATRVLGEEEVGAAGDAALGAQIRALWILLSRLQAQLSRRIAVFEERGAPARDGARSIRDWLRHRLRVDGTEAARQATVATAFATRPRAATAYLRGEISTDHALAICEAGWQLGDATMARGAERTLVDRARREPPGRVRRLARRLRERADPAGGLQAFRLVHEERWFDVVRTAGGAIALRGQLGPADGELLLTALAAQQAGADPAGGPAARSSAQRHADALAAVCRSALRADVRWLGDRPRVTVTVPLHALRDVPPHGEAVFGSGEPVPAETARRLACDARVVPAVLGSASEPLDIGAETATVPQGVRRALELRDRRCRFPGCDRPPAECEAHHERHWSGSGPSTVDNLLLLCPHHHVLAHEGRWRVTRNPYSGDVRAWRPDGTRLDEVSPPPDP